VLGIVYALPASRPGEGRSAGGRAVINGRKTLLCFVYAEFFGNIQQLKGNLSQNVLEVGNSQ
jgi:hypothetical protein